MPTAAPQVESLSQAARRDMPPALRLLARSVAYADVSTGDLLKFLTTPPEPSHTLFDIALDATADSSTLASEPWPSAQLVQAYARLVVELLTSRASQVQVPHRAAMLRLFVHCVSPAIIQNDSILEDEHRNLVTRALELLVDRDAVAELVTRLAPVQDEERRVLVDVLQALLPEHPLPQALAHGARVVERH
jgi:hypothetical protein